MTGEEQWVLRLLSVFVAGFRLEDVEQVVLPARGAAGSDVLVAMEVLSEQSLVVGEAAWVGAPGSGCSTRWRSMRVVACWRPGSGTGRPPRTRSTSGRWLRRWLPATGMGVRWTLWRALTVNTRTSPPPSSAAWPQATPPPRRVSTWALWMYWWLRGHLTLGRRLAESVLEHELPAGVVSRAELAAATMAFALDDLTAALGWWSSALAHAEDDPVTTANAVAGEGLVALARGDLDTAAERFELARPIAERGGTDGEWTRALSLIWLGTVRLLEGDADGAVAHIEQGLDSARARGDRLTSYIALFNLSQVEMSRGDHIRARGHLEEGLRLSRQTGDLANLAYLLDASAVLQAARGTHARVPVLLGAAQVIRETIGSRGYGYYRPDPAATEGAAREARQHLGEDGYDDALDLGRRLTPDEATDFALASDAAPSLIPRHGEHHSYTSRTPAKCPWWTLPWPGRVRSRRDRVKQPRTGSHREPHPATPSPSIHR